jgi:molecular chaperone HscB
MSSPTTAPTLQVCRDCGAGAPLDAHFCPQCTKILSLGRHGDYFSFLGLPRKLGIEAADLERRFRALSRQFHPDYFYKAGAAERRASLERSSYLNDAYRTLKNPIARVEYLLDREGFAARSPGETGETGEADESAKRVPPALLEEVFALNEELDEIRALRAGGAPPEEWKTRLERARGPIDVKRAAHEQDLHNLSARWDAVVHSGVGDDERREVLTALRDRLLERNYINNLLAGIERELNS